MNIEDFREVAKHLEPSAWAGGDGLEPYAVSAAVSLKRIADAQERIASRLEAITEVYPSDGTGQLRVGANCDVRQVG